MDTAEIARILDAMHPAPHPVLREIEERSAVDGVPIASRATGRFLAVMVTAMQANRILEVGTGYGYATLWMALAQPHAGKIWTIDPHARSTDVARTYFSQAGEAQNIEVFNTPTLELLENFPQRNLDLAFVSAASAPGTEHLELLLAMLKLSGVAIFDDAFSHRAFTERFLAHPAFDARGNAP